ncbi:hypothetical protein J6590_085536 [Homalodisca vitripennis]|nr:hypothetical protein J6590_085536 [Homalodisca vitripennis]
MVEDLIHEEVSDLAIIDDTVKVAVRRVVTTDVTPSPRGSARYPLIVYYITLGVAARRLVSTDVTPSPRGSERCPLIVYYTTLGVAARRVVSTDVTPSPRGSARCPLIVYYTTLGVAARRVVSTDVTPSPCGSARCQLLVFCTNDNWNRCDGTVVYLRSELCGGSRQIKLGEATGLQHDFDVDGRHFDMLAIYRSPAMKCQLFLSDLELYYSKLANNTS